MKKKMLSKSELFKEGYVKGLKRAQVLIEKMIDLKLANNIFLESFKDDVLSGYKKLGYETLNNRLLTTIKAVNSQNEIKELVKQLVGKVPNVGLAVTKKYTPEEFIDFVSKAQKNLNIKQLQQQEKELRKLKASSASDDYYIYPCRTLEEAHRAAFSHTGNLKKLSREDREKFFKELYGINIPKPRTHYETDKTPELMLEFMKECPVFMEPTWCVCVDEYFWSRYNLQADKNEDAKCFVVISKTHPNVRFCITRDVTDRDIKNTIDGDYVISWKGLGEFRDIWQIGGRDVSGVGMKMAKLAFGDISGILNNVLEKYERVTFEEITDGNLFFFRNENITSFTKNLTSLVNGVLMFSCCSNLTSFTSELPSLTVGRGMFYLCYDLKSFTSELPKLINGKGMFWNCENLSHFTSKLPNLADGESMFTNCSDLTSFNIKLPSLTNGNEMFRSCKNLSRFTSKLPNLADGESMFYRCCDLKYFNIELPKLTKGYDMFGACYSLTSFTSELPSLAEGEAMFFRCKNLSHFTSKLPNLKDGSDMFSDCKLDKPSVLNILASITKVNNAKIDIGVGYDYMKDEDTLRAILVAELKGWNVSIMDNH